MKKIYVLDTSTIIDDPYCLNSFSDAHIIIHIKVLEELDKLKTLPAEAGKNTRVFVRFLDKISNEGDLNSGIKLSKNNTLIIDSNNYQTTDFDNPNYTDNTILSCAKNLTNRKTEVTIVSQDINLRLRAKSFKIKAIQHKKEKTTVDEIYNGIIYINNQKLGEDLKDKKSIKCSENQELRELFPNQCVVIENNQKKIIALGRKQEDKINIIKNTKAWGLTSTNLEQAFALDLLLDDKVPFVTLAGIAGTGKSILAIAGGLEKVVSQKIYDKLIIYRPIQTLGNDLGFLPGSISEKLEPFYLAIQDSFDALSTSAKKGKNNWKNDLAQYADNIYLEAITYIRGRSINNGFIICDESQQLDVGIIKTLLTRCGKNTKIVLDGDIEQIDNYKLDALNNGLTNVIERFKESDLAGHITLKQVERSPLAEAAAKLL